MYGVQVHLIKDQLQKILIEGVVVPPTVIASQATVPETQVVTTAAAKLTQAEILLAALGGADNLVSFDNCITRLRVVLQDTGLIDAKQIKSTGAVEVIKLGKQNLQIVYGVQVHLIKDQLDKLLTDA